MNISSVTKFVKSNLATGDDFGSVKAGRDEATRVDTEVGRIHQDTVDVRGSLDTLKEDSQLKPPTFADVSNKQVMMGAVGAGAFIGGSIGVVSNLAAGGSASVTFNEQVIPINEQKLDGAGFTQKFYTVGGTPENPEGFDIESFRQSPLINEKIGEYTKRTPSVSGSSNIAVSGLIGAGIGAGVGAAAGGATILLRKALKKDYNGSAPRETEGDNKLLIASGIAGAAVGGLAGGVSALVNSTTTEYETQSIPAMKTEVLGQMPAGEGFYVPADEVDGNTPTPSQVADWTGWSQSKLERNGFRGAQNLRPRDITGQVPEKTLLGNPKVNTETKTVSVGPSLLGSVAGGMAVGAVTGVAGGVLVNVLRKTL